MTNTTSLSRFRPLVGLVLAPWVLLTLILTACAPASHPVQRIDVQEPSELGDALLAAGFDQGDPTDGCDCVLVPEGTVLDVPGGTWTITADGPVRCTDWLTTGAECSGSEFA